MDETLQSKQEDFLGLFFKKKTVVCFFLSVLVMFIHIHSFDGYEYTGTTGKALSFIGRFLTSGMTGCAIRLFFLISGVLFYRNYQYCLTLDKYRTRVESLLIPYLFWCTLYTIGMMLLGKTPFGSLVAFDTRVTIKNILMGVFLNQYYSSFWFILNLIVFTLLCPIIYTVLKNKVIGAVALVALIVLYGVGIRIPEMVQIYGEEYVVFWRADSIIFYMMGSYIGIHYFEWFAQKKPRIFAILGCVVFIVCSIYRTLGGRFNGTDAGLGYILYMTIFSFSIWFMFDLCSFGNQLKEYVGYSFMMFALNFYLGVYVSKILYIVLPKGQIWCLVNLLITVSVELMIILGFSSALKHRFLRFYKFITGGR